MSVAEQVSPSPVPAPLAGSGLRITTRGRMLRSFLRDTPAVVALIVLIVILLAAIFANVISPHDPIAQEITKRLQPPVWMKGGNSTYLLGTDKLGRDILSRILYGSRISLILGFVSSTIALVIGLFLGLIAGYYGGTLGDVIMRAADTWLAFPFLVAAIAIIAVVGTGFPSLLALLSVLGWATFGKVTRGQVLSVKKKEYIEAAHVLGAPTRRILFKHLLPNVLSPSLVLWTFSVATIIVVEAGLSFLGLGVQPPTPAWGSMLADGRELLATAWWIATFPGLAIVITVLTVNILGDALRDILDPRLL